MAVTRALRFSDHVTKRNGGSGDENACYRKRFIQEGEVNSSDLADPILVPRASVSFGRSIAYSFQAKVIRILHVIRLSMTR